MYRFCLFIFILLALAILIVYPISIGGSYSKSLLLYTLLIGAFSVALFIFSSVIDPVKELRRQYIRPIYMFLIGYIIVFFQAYVDLFLENLQPNAIFFFIKPGLINQAAILSVTGLIMVFVGYLTGRKRVSTKKKITPLSYLPTKQLIYVLTFFNVFNIFLNGQQMLSGEYSQEAIESSAGTVGAYVQLLFYVSYLSIIVIHSINSRVLANTSIIVFLKKLGPLFYINLIIYLLLVMLSGDRGPILTMSLTLIAAMTVGTQSQFRLGTIIFAIVLGASFISVLGVVRKMDEQLTFQERISRAWSEDVVGERYQSVLPATAELSTSVRTLHIALDYVPVHHSYLLGMFQLRETLKVVPFASGFFDPMFPAHFRYRNSAFFITWVDKGDNYKVGTGSSINADLYLSFGEIGVVVFLFLLGRLFRWVDLLIFSRGGMYISLFSVVLMISIVGSSIYWSRASLLTPVQSVALAYIFVIVYRKIILKPKPAR